MLKKLTQKRKKKGFTLVELVVVIAILGILMAIAVPRLSGFRKNAGLAADQSTAASIAKAADLYSISHNLDDTETGKGKLAKAINHTATASNDHELQTDELIDKELKPQNSDKDNFILKYDYNSTSKKGTKNFYVVYNDYATATVDNKVILYPENFTPTATE